VAAHRIDLLPRHRVPVFSWALLGIGLAFALGVLALAWTIEGRERSLLGQALAVLLALSLMSAASTQDSVVGRQAAAQVFSKTQAGRILLLAGLFSVGLWLTFFRL